MTIDTFNQFAVGVRGDEIIIGRSPMPPLTRAEALNIAAWIVALADVDDQFDELRREVENT